MFKECLLMIGVVLAMYIFIDLQFPENEVLIVDYTTPRPVSIINNEKEKPDPTWHSSITPTNEK